MSEKCIKGINQIVETAKKFLTELREFAPFGLLIKEGKWLNLATYDEDMDSNNMRSLLINSIIKYFEDGNAEFGAVCIDARIANIGDVIVIYNTSNGKDWYELVYKYELKDDEVNIIEENIEHL